jgi:hypothetical protein
VWRHPTWVHVRLWCSDVGSDRREDEVGPARRPPQQVKLFHISAISFCYLDRPVLFLVSY